MIPSNARSETEDGDIEVKQTGSEGLFQVIEKYHFSGIVDGVNELLAEWKGEVRKKIIFHPLYDHVGLTFFRRAMKMDLMSSLKNLRTKKSSLLLKK